MRRELFLLELKRALQPSLGLALAGTLVLFALEKALVIRRGENPATAWGAVHLLLLSGIALSGLFAGGRVFSREFKSHHHPLLAVLPLSSTSTWIVLCLAGLTGSALAIGSVAALRPALVADTQSGRLLALAALTHLYLFAVGSCLALMFRRWFLVPVVGFPLAAAVLHETLMLAPVGDRLLPVAASPGVIGGFSFFVLASAVLYVRGEFDLPKIRVRQGIVVFGGSFLLVLVCRVAFPAPLVPTGDWFHGVKLSPDGLHLVRIAPGWAGSDSVCFASGRTGEPLGSWTAVALKYGAWAVDEDAFWIETIEEPLFRIASVLTGPSPVLRRIGVDGSERASHQVAASAILDFEPLPRGQVLAMLTDGLSSRVELLGGANEAKVLAAGGDPDASYLVRAPGDRLVIVLGTGTNARGWIHGPSGLEPLTTVPPAADQKLSRPYVVERRLYFTETQATAELERLYPRPDGAVEGEHVASRALCDSGSTVFFVDRLSPAREALHVWDRSEHRWRVVAEEVARSDTGELLRLEPELGIAAYQVAGPNGVDAFLFDASLGRSIPLARAEGPPAPIHIRPGSGAGILVHWRPSGREAEGVISYEHGSGVTVMVPSPKHPGDWSLVHRTDGSGIIQRRGDIVVRDSNGTERLVEFCP